MTIRLNGQEHQTGAGTVAELLRETGVVAERVAVELNMVIIKKADYGAAVLHEGDQIEVVSFIGGGSGKGEGAP